MAAISLQPRIIADRADSGRPRARAVRDAWIARRNSPVGVRVLHCADAAGHRRGFRPWRCAGIRHRGPGSLVGLEQLVTRNFVILQADLAGLHVRNLRLDRRPNSPGDTLRWLPELSRYRQLVVALCAAPWHRKTAYFNDDVLLPNIFKNCEIAPLFSVDLSVECNSHAFDTATRGCYILRFH